MSRTSRVPYHQNVYDLLGIEPAVCPDVRGVIDAHERTARRSFPAAIRELYIATGGTDPFGTYDYIYPAETILSAWALWPRDEGWLCIGGFKGQTSDFVRFDGTADPVVVANVGSLGEAPARLERGAGERYTDYIFGDACGVRDDRPEASDLWVCARDEPLAVPVIDFLAEQFGDPERTPRDGDVTTYTWRPDGGTLRVTADDPAHPDPLGAWWVHAATAEQLAEFARLLRPWGTLGRTLRADTDEARAVWEG